MEIWKDIEGFSNLQASTHGRLKNTDYRNRWRNGNGRTQVLKPALAPDGYLMTVVRNIHGKDCSWKVHKFIALAFHGQRDHGLDVDHIDGNKQNNRPENLEYVTRSENMKRAYRLGLMIPKKHDLNGNSKLTWKEVNEIRAYAKDHGRIRADGRLIGYGRKELAERYNISQAHIKDIISKRRGVWT